MPFCREVFADFDPVAVSKFNEKKLIAAGSTASSLLSELKLRSIIENARQISKVHILLLLILYKTIALKTSRSITTHKSISYLAT